MAASRAFTSGTIKRVNFIERASIAIGKVPRIPRTPPSRDSSPTNTQSSSSFLFNPPQAPRIPQRHGQVEAGAFLANVGGRKVHRAVGWWNVIAAVTQGGAHSILALAYRGIGQ